MSASMSMNKLAVSMDDNASLLSGASVISKASQNAMKPCYFHIRGRCSFGKKCQFSHDVESMEAKTERPRVNIDGSKEHLPNLEKTRMCVYFQAGKCMYNEKCTFAHSKDELVQVSEEEGSKNAEIRVKEPVIKSSKKKAGNLPGTIKSESGSTQATGVESQFEFDGNNTPVYWSTPNMTYPAMHVPSPADLNAQAMQMQAYLQATMPNTYFDANVQDMQNVYGNYSNNMSHSNHFNNMSGNSMNTMNSHSMNMNRHHKHY